jgi:hypothetical protein
MLKRDFDLKYGGCGTVPIGMAARKKEFRTKWKCERCPLHEDCSKGSWERAWCVSYISREDCIKKVVSHLLTSGKHWIEVDGVEHKESMTEEDAIVFAEGATYVENEEEYDASDDRNQRRNDRNHHGRSEQPKRAKVEQDADAEAKDEHYTASRRGPHLPPNPPHGREPQGAHATEISRAQVQHADDRADRTSHAMLQAAQAMTSLLPQLASLAQTAAAPSPAPAPSPIGMAPPRMRAIGDGSIGMRAIGDGSIIGEALQQHTTDIARCADILDRAADAAAHCQQLSRDAERGFGIEADRIRSSATQLRDVIRLQR